MVLLSLKRDHVLLIWSVGNTSGPREQRLNNVISNRGNRNERFTVLWMFISVVVVCAELFSSVLSPILQAFPCVDFTVLFWRLSNVRRPLLTDINYAM